ncbi:MULTISPECIES: polyprenyl synthetase family protein [unclassified Streptomyces]|uniref:polyprenyl synthetase family protein n=1 Tax=unclassified Streptomyces TaxID=2593676 RepID=UPI00382C9E10
MNTPPSAPSAHVLRLLAAARRRTDAVIVPLLERVGPAPARVLAYQWGVWGAQGQPVQGSRTGGGKAVRAALVFACARATGRPDTDPLVPAGAAAVEMLHTLSLLHDDVMDGDELRRGRPAAWRVFGSDAVEDAVRALTPHAVGLLFDTLPEPAATTTATGLPGSPPPRDPETLRAPARATAVLGDALVRLAQGQALDLALEREPSPGVAATLRVHADKTGSLFACACALGAAPAAASDLTAFGEHLGIAFQITDDVLGVWGDPAVTGKPAGADLSARKKSHPVAVALTPDPDRADEDIPRQLHGLYALPRPWTASERAEAGRLLDRSGARSVSQAAARGHARAALTALARVCPPHEEAGEDLRALASFVTGRPY